MVRPTSAAFLRTLRGSHAAVSRARVVAPGQSGTNPDGTELAIIDGDVLLDASSAIRGDLRLTVQGNSLWPSKRNLLLAPYGNEIYVERGVAFGNGTREWVGLGYFRIGNLRRDRPNGPITLTAQDRMAKILDARLVRPRQFLASRTYGSIVDELVLEVHPGAVIQWDSGSGQTIGRPLVLDTDRWQFLDDLLQGLGKIWYWDYQGRLQVRVPAPTSQPVWTVDAGRKGVLVELREEIDREPCYNGAVVTGEAADTTAPVSYVAVDLDAQSPTYWYGTFGQKPEFYNHPTVTTVAQARQAAETMLRRNIGLPHSVDFRAVPNAALEPWDPVEIRPSVRDSVSTHVLATVGIPLAGGEMTGTTREQTTLRIGSI